MNEDPASTTSTPRTLVDDILNLVSLPEVYLRLQGVIDDPMHSREDVAEVIKYDPSLSARILRIANSSYYGFAKRVENVPSAVGLIGEVELRNIVLASTVVKSMSALKYCGVDIDLFWTHSVQCGVTARLFSTALGDSNAESLFLAGMLHDIGILVLYQAEPALASTVALHAKQNKQSRDEAERELLGFDHAEVGELLADAWRLSPQLGELIRSHHRTYLAKDYLSEARILSLANKLAVPDFETPDTEADKNLDESVKCIGLNPSDLAELLEKARLQGREIQSIICG